MLVCHFDYVSPAAAVAVLRLHTLVAEGYRVGFSGIDVLGVETALPVTLDQLAELDRVRDRAAGLGLTMRRPSSRPPTLAAHLVGGLAEQADLGVSWREIALQAYWRDDADLGDDAVLIDLAASAGLDPSSTAAALADRQLRVRLRQRMLTARGRGIGGVPVLDVDGTLVPADLPDEDLRRLAQA